MDPEQDAMMLIASLMAVSARTAPKGKGVDTIVTRIIYGEDLDRIADEMIAIGNKTGLPPFPRDAQNIRDSVVCLLIGCRGTEDLGLNCGGCGFRTCKEMREKVSKSPVLSLFSGPNCVIRMADLGIATGSAAKTAQIHNADNRILFTAGVAALSLHMLPDCTCAYGIPLSATGKNIFFDRRPVS
ncbi:MAG TPA: DUF2148 domain-containing protein [Methanospirillum sp.]|nr:DUF2148 domain-containing protein [Methanospirillum sp.]HOJ96476.1 DUF2148 domain-containing protein [Methanospirillum sp.]HOL42040.1 DUF2148 domain-containing protein [Methanospirillum sp.]HPP77277.1 DUF2148 domain-containing protein [Methanospirillum sp.]